MPHVGVAADLGDYDAYGEINVFFSTLQKSELFFP
jgi:hypothetical protein